MDVQQLQADLECPLCFELFQNARCLSCLHTFCHDCLVAYMVQQRTKTSIPCPICSDTTDLPSGDITSLKTNLVVNRMVVTWKAAVSSSDAASTSSGHVNGQSTDECAIHPQESLTHFCCVCMVVICRDCIVGDHQNHTFEKLETAVVNMKRDIQLASEAALPFLPKLQRAKAVVLGKERDAPHLSEAAQELEKEINAAADSALNSVTDVIQRQRSSLLAQVAVLRNTSSGAFLDKIGHTIGATLNLARSAAGDTKGRCLSPVEVAEIYQGLRRKLVNIVDSCSEGGLLDNMGDLTAPSFAENTDIVRQVSLGQMKYPTKWRLARTFTLPPKRVGDISAMMALSNGKLAMGYRKGGIDIIDPLMVSSHHTILGDVKILDFSFFEDGSVVVVTLGRKLQLFDPIGTKLETSFNTPATSGLMSVDVDESGDLIVGFAEHHSIHIYERSGGDPAKVIDVDDFDPWTVVATSMGRILCKNMLSIKVFDRSGKVRATISETPPLCHSATVDKFGNLFVTVLRKKERISIAKHQLDGTLEGIITQEQVVSKVDDKKYWLTLAAISTNCLAVSDTHNVFFYRNAPLMPDLMKLAK